MGASQIASHGSAEDGIADVRRLKSRGVDGFLLHGKLEKPGNKKQAEEIKQVYIRSKLVLFYV